MNSNGYATLQGTEQRPFPTELPFSSQLQWGQGWSFWSGAHAVHADLTA